MPDAPLEAESQPEATPNDDPETPEPEGEATVTVQDGRRRGRRRVMKKKKVKDEDGYLGKQNLLALASVPDHI
jgi:DNA polymerase delta subunit 3